MNCPPKLKIYDKFKNENEQLLFLEAAKSMSSTQKTNKNAKTKL